MCSSDLGNCAAAKPETAITAYAASAASTVSVVNFATNELIFRVGDRVTIANEVGGANVGCDNDVPGHYTVTAASLSLITLDTSANSWANAPTDITHCKISRAATFFKPNGGKFINVKFTDDDWNIPRRITVIALNDDVDEPHETRKVHFTMGWSSTTALWQGTGSAPSVSDDPVYRDAPRGTPGTAYDNAGAPTLAYDPILPVYAAYQGGLGVGHDDTLPHTQGTAFVLTQWTEGLSCNGFVSPISAVATTVDAAAATTAGSGVFGFGATNDLMEQLQDGDTILISQVASANCEAAGTYTVASAVSAPGPPPTWTVTVDEALPAFTAVNCQMSRPSAVVNTDRTVTDRAYPCAYVTGMSQGQWKPPATTAAKPYIVSTPITVSVVDDDIADLVVLCGQNTGPGGTMAATAGVTTTVPGSGTVDSSTGVPNARVTGTAGTMGSDIVAAAATASGVPPAPLADMSRSTRLRESSFIASTRSGPSGAFSLPVASGDGNRKLPPVPGVWSNPLPPAIFADAGVFIASETAADPSPACCHRTSRTPPLMCAAIVYITALPPP